MAAMGKEAGTLGENSLAPLDMGIPNISLWNPVPVEYLFVCVNALDARSKTLG